MLLQQHPGKERQNRQVKYGLPKAFQIRTEFGVFEFNTVSSFCEDVIKYLNSNSVCEAFLKNIWNKFIDK